QCIVENKNSRVTDQSTRDGSALLLPARKGNSALPHQCFVLVRKAFDLIGDIRRLRCPAYLVVGGLLHSKGYVLAHSFAEQECFLRHKANVAPQNRKRIFADGF